MVFDVRVTRSELPTETPTPSMLGAEAMLFEIITSLHLPTDIPVSWAVALFPSMVTSPQLATAIDTCARRLFWPINRLAMLSRSIPSSAPPMFPTMVASLKLQPLIANGPPSRLLLLTSKLLDMLRKITPPEKHSAPPLFC